MALAQWLHIEPPIARSCNGSPFWFHAHVWSMFCLFVHSCLRQYLADVTILGTRRHFVLFHLRCFLPFLVASLMSLTASLVTIMLQYHVHSCIWHFPLLCHCYVHFLHSHDDVIKWKHFPRNWLFVRGIHRSPVNSLQKGQWRGALMFSLICVWIYDWVNNREVGDLRCYRAHYDVSVMQSVFCFCIIVVFCRK